MPHDDKHTLRPAGDLGLSAAEALRPLLLEALAAGRPVEVDLSSATLVDLPALQLLLSARRSFGARGLDFAIAGTSDVLKETCRRAAMNCSGGTTA